MTVVGHAPPPAPDGGPTPQAYGARGVLASLRRAVPPVPPDGGNWNHALREPRLGVMLHYDGSVTDRGALDWLLRDERCAVSYQAIVLDDGTVQEIAPVWARAWHAGVCRPSDPTRLPYRDANSAFYGVAIAARAGDAITPRQLVGVLSFCEDRFRAHAWRDAWRLTSHHLEAWPRGRRADIGTGIRGFDLEGTRRLLAAMLADRELNERPLG